MPLKTTLLEQIGLTKAEINVYLALLELGSSTTGPIVEKSQASSSKIYEILEKLLQKGLASFVIKNGMKFFEASNPQRLLDYLKEKETELKTQEQELQQMLPELELKRTLSKYKSEATIYKGMKGLETAFQDIFKTCKKGDTNYVFVVGQLDERMNEFFKRHYTLRAQQGINTKTIFSEAGRDLYESRKNIPLFEGKIVGTTTSPATVNIYGSKVNLRMGESKNVICMVIDNKELADSFLEQFNLLWNQDITVAKGMSAVLQALKGFVNEIQPGDTFDALEAAFGVKGSQEEFAREFTKYHQYRLSRGIRGRWLFQQGVHNIIEAHKENYRLGEIKFLPYQAESPVSIHPYKNRTLMIIQEKDPTVVTINNREITGAFHRAFESLWNQDIRVYKGFEEVLGRFKSMLDSLREGEEYQVLGASHGEGGKRLVDWFMEYHHERIQRKIKARLLAAAKDYKAIIPQMKETGDPEMTLSALKVLPPEFSSPMQINLYPNNKVLMFLWGKELMCFEIESEILYQNFKNYFEALWHQKIISLEGEEGVKAVFEESLQYSDVWFIKGNDGIQKYFPHYWEHYNKQRIQKKVVWHDLIDANLRGNLFPGQERRKVPYYEHKVLPQELSSPHVIMFFGSKVVNIIWGKKTTLTVIEDSEIFKGYKRYFDFLWNQQTFTYYGYEGLQTVIKDTLNHKEVLFIGAGGYVLTRMPEFWKEHNKIRLKRKILWKGLAREELLQSALPKEKLFEYKLMPKAYQTPNVVWIFGDKVANILWLEQPIAFVIENKEVAQSYREYFEYLWK